MSMTGHEESSDHGYDGHRGQGEMRQAFYLGTHLYGISRNWYLDQCRKNKNCPSTQQLAQETKLFCCVADCRFVMA